MTKIKNRRGERDYSQRLLYSQGATISLFVFFPTSTFSVLHPNTKIRAYAILCSSDIPLRWKACRHFPIQKVNVVAILLTPTCSRHNSQFPCFEHLISLAEEFWSLCFLAFLGWLWFAYNGEEGEHVGPEGHRPDTGYHGILCFVLLIDNMYSVG